MNLEINNSVFNIFDLDKKTSLKQKIIINYFLGKVDKHLSKHNVTVWDCDNIDHPINLDFLKQKKLMLQFKVAETIEFDLQDDFKMTIDVDNTVENVFRFDEGKLKQDEVLYKPVIKNDPRT